MGQDLGDPVEVVTAKTVHRATAYPELERCATFRGVHVKPVCGCLVSTFHIWDSAPTGKRFRRHKACLGL